MSCDLVLISTDTGSRNKEVLPPVDWPKKLRSRVPRIKRAVLVPLFAGEEEQVERDGGAQHSALEADSSSSCFASAITTDSSLIASRNGNSRKRPREASSQSAATDATGAAELRPITRLYARQIESLKKEEIREDECSEVGFSSGARFGGKSSKQRINLGGGANEVILNSSSELSVSESTHVSGDFSRKNFKAKARSRAITDIVPEISESSCVESISAENDPIIPKLPVLSQSSTVHKDDISCEEINQQLACSEQLSSCGGENSANSTNNEMTLSEFETELFGGSSEEYFSDLSQSFLAESSDNFSEKSRDDSNPSVAYSLYLQLAEQFSALPPRDSSITAECETSSEFVLMRFEDEGDEESYRGFRNREKKAQVLDYAEEYNSMEEHGVMVLQERLLMVNWIVEHSNAVQLQNETLFLGVSLMDRFLSKGFFKTKRNLHLLGIASVTLATRLEENQPYNSVRRKTFMVGEHTYSRFEVVAMEWLVQEVLNFQCFLPTIYNFLWFYLKAAKADESVENQAKHLAVLSLMDPDRSRFWPSTVAAGLVVLASLAANRDDSCQWVMETHVRSKNDDLSECTRSLQWLVKHVS